jgi:hypothetical protein
MREEGIEMNMSMPRILLTLALGCLLPAQDRGSIAGNPFSTPKDVAASAARHGADAIGGMVAPSLVTGTFKHGGSDEALFGVITKGVPGHAIFTFGFPSH